jgi:titin
MVSGNRVQGNFIGINADGTAGPSKPFGIAILANNNQIGDSTPAARNVISNNQVGIDIQAGTGNQVQGNYFGTDKSGATALGNIISVLIRVGSPHDNLIGGTSPGAGNLISGNQIAIQVETGSNNVLQGNLIGTDASGDSGYT